MANFNNIEVTKKRNTKDRYKDEQYRELAKCMIDPIYFIENYVMIQHALYGRVPFKMFDYQKRMVNAFYNHQNVISMCGRQLGKALALDTPILTPSGFVKLEELKVGDTIYGSNGKPTIITFITDTMHDRKCYEIEFAHGEKIIADAEHLWTIELPKTFEPTVTCNTEELIDYITKYKKKGHSVHIKNCETLDFGIRDSLPLDPYILGMWIGDGSRCDPVVCCHIDDYDHYVTKVEQAGHGVTKHRLDLRSITKTTGCFGINNDFKAKLKEINVFQNKHIPQQYLFSSLENRLALLQGLMDTDGYASKEGMCQFYQSDVNIIESVRFLLSSLGIKSLLSEKETGYKTAYTLTFTTNKYPVFTLPRKLERQMRNRNHSQNTRMFFKTITEVPSVPVRCLQVDNENKLFLCGNTLIPTHNTTCAASFILWKAMFEPDQTILIAANKYVQALEIMDKIRFAYENLEKYNWLRAGVIEYNKGTLSFDNGSRIISRATSPDAGRGLAISLLYLDEFAFVHPNKAEEFWTAMQPTLSTGGSCIVTSTPNNNEDRFAQIWFDAINNYDDDGREIENGVGRNDFFPIKVTWEEHPDRDGKWAIKNRSQLGEEKFLREMACEFISADDTLINGLSLNTLRHTDEIFKIDGSRWFSEPQPNCVYGVALDPAIGAGRGDFAAIQVYNLVTMEQIAEWRSATTQIANQIEILLKVLYYIYQTLNNDPAQQGEPEIYWTVENNSCGEAALVVIDETGEENFPGFFVHEPRNGRRRKGLTTTSKSKMSACSRLKSLLESNRMTIRSKPLITELKNFVQTGGGFQAKANQHDDLVSSTLLIIRILQIISHWDPDINTKLSDAIEMDEMEIAPMPFVM